MAARLLAELAFGSTSDAYKKLVLDQQKAETIFGRRADEPRSAALRGHGRRQAEPETCRRCRSAGRDDRAIPDEAGRCGQQLAKVKRHEKYGFLMQLDSPLHTAEAVVPFISAAGSLDAVDRLYKASEQVTPEDIQRPPASISSQRRTVVVLKGEQK